jgi:hypothetical protein
MQRAVRSAASMSALRAKSALGARSSELQKKLQRFKDAGVPTTSFSTKRPINQSITTMKKPTVSALLITSLGLLACPLCAAEKAAKGGKAKGPKQAFTQLDADKSGAISLEEFKASAKNPAKADKRFAALDKNADGNLSTEEFSAKPAKKKAAGDAKKAGGGGKKKSKGAAPAGE